MGHKTITHDFSAFTDTSANIRKWIEEENECDLPSGRHHAEQEVE